VRRSGGGGEQRGGVERADAEPVQVAGEGAGIAQPASRAQLQPVGRRRGRGRAFAAGRLAHPTTVLPAARPALTPPAAPPPRGRAAVPRSSPPARNGPGAAGGPGRAADGCGPRRPPQSTPGGAAGAAPSPRRNGAGTSADALSWAAPAARASAAGPAPHGRPARCPTTPPLARPSCCSTAPT